MGRISEIRQTAHWQASTMLSLWPVRPHPRRIPPTWDAAGKRRISQTCLRLRWASERRSVETARKFSPPKIVHSWTRAVRLRLETKTIGSKAKPRLPHAARRLKYHHLCLIEPLLKSQAWISNQRKSAALNVLAGRAEIVCRQARRLP